MALNQWNSFQWVTHLSVPAPPPPPPSGLGPHSHGGSEGGVESEMVPLGTSERDRGTPSLHPGLGGSTAESRSPEAGATPC